MFSRIKGAIDSRIAEEQARARAAATPPARAASKRSRPKPKFEDDGSRGPDPSEFEGAFVIDDESEPPSRTGTPMPTNNSQTKMAEDEVTQAASMAEPTTEKDTAASPRASSELPLEVRTKLRKLDKLESRYQELLRSYRIAHARAVSIEPFEKTLRENTPLTTIKEPEALIEYLSQLSLRGDMVMDELKQVSADRDEYKRKFEQSEKKVSEVKQELIAVQSASKAPSAQAEAPPDHVKEEETTPPEQTTSALIKSPTSSVLGVLSPKSEVPTVAKDDNDVSQSFFSYDDEIPRVQADLKAKESQVHELQEEVQTLKKELNLAKETNGGLTESLTSLEQQISDSKQSEAISDRQTEVHEIQERLDGTVNALEELKSKAAAQTNLLDETRTDLTSKASDLAESNTLNHELDGQLKELQGLKAAAEAKISQLEEEITKLKEEYESRVADEDTDRRVAKASESISSVSEAPIISETPATTSLSSKKKKNKKKKGKTAVKDNVVTKSDSVDEGAATLTPDTAVVDELHGEISKLRDEVASRDAEIEKLQTKRRTEADLREEIENMQENLLNIGQEHVEAKEKIKDLQAEKKVLQDKIDALEKDLTTQKAAQADSTKTEDEYKKMLTEVQDLKIKSTSLQSDLGAAQQLAAARYKELTDLRGVMEKAQPEMRSLRNELASLKTAKDELNARTAELLRLEGREKDLKADIANFKRQASDREREVQSLNEKVSQETNGRLKAEDQARLAGRDLRRVEADKIELSANNEKASRELAKTQGEVGRLRNAVRELDSQVARLSTENQTIREEVELKISQYASAQGLVGSMRDQTAEMAMQLKEVREQSESLEEELAEVQRLLAERTRDGETMRRLLSDVDDRADAKVREMRERMETAIEERDRAEEEASTNARRRAREVDDLKNKIKDAERDLKRALDDKDDLERSQKEWRKRREELERGSERATHELTEINAAMGELRDALNGSEKQAREAEKQKIDLRRLLDDANQRYEKLHKSLKSKEKRLEELSAGNSSRSSMDGDVGASRRTNGSVNGMGDNAYLKTVLLQFLEQKDKKLQGQLVPVLGKLLQFDKKDEQKWIAAISAR
ncbi:MAG: hypothetical protein M1818_003473 [Claussenomyces sp. TS43310]|nr:MAG: hypothetical protein M1818_003473 [Claussenomyces sp. TS43310]